MYMGRIPASDRTKKKPAGCGGPLRIKGGLESRHHRCRRAASAGLLRHQRHARAAAAAWRRARDCGDGDPRAHGAKHPDSGCPRQLQSSNALSARALERDEERSAELPRARRACPKGSPTRPISSSKRRRRRWPGGSTRCRSSRSSFTASSASARRSRSAGPTGSTAAASAKRRRSRTGCTRSAPAPPPSRASRPDALEHALLIKYGEGAGLGWHRDRPVFGDVIGISPAVAGAACASGAEGRREMAALHPAGRAALDLPAARPVAERMGAQPDAGRDAALLDHVQDAAIDPPCRRGRGGGPHEVRWRAICSAVPSTGFRLVPLPMSFAHGRMRCQL